MTDDKAIEAAARVIAERLCHGSVLNPDVSMDYCLSCSDCGCIAMARAVLAAAEAEAWRPIETAPMDGRIIIADNGSGISVLMAFHTRRRRWEYYDGTAAYDQPRRWRPLPSPPAAGGAAGGVPHDGE